ncbi:restriction endonuclease subunit S [Acinetobacter junii]|uniref:restriction endonuclease subunit S n=1 Tax=Acinetobacter junii TaxID=40215 RepID=UPI0021CDC192|nr:restriction endonuclease subunit S [Acinetobacter junii]MCU4407497.1 restriction endonuclease subunit S [Acinetobacter junii]
MAKYQAYAEYKDSGVEWLGEVPNDWDILSIARVSNKITNGYVGATRDIFFDSGIRYLQSLHIKNNNINFHTPYYVSESWSNEKSKSILKEGDVLIVQTGDIGQVAAVTKEFEGCNCHALIIVSGTEKISGFYLAWLLNSNYGRQTLKSIQTGALHPHLNCDAIKDIKIPLPDIDIQNKITSFLDHETTKIDHLIEKQQQLIELLKEKRQAVISHAVTKGLNPNVPMKDSGVEWLGQVPEHWGITPLKHQVETINGFGFSSNDFCDEGVPFIRAGNIKQKSINNVEIFLPQEIVNKYKRVILSAGDVVISMVGSDPTVKESAVGQIGIIPTHFEGAVPNQNVVILREKKCNLLKKYLFYSLCSTAYRTHLDIFSHKLANQAIISSSLIISAKFTMPRVDEQLEIINYLDNQLLKFDQMMLKAESAIQLMQERRTALISAAVTGKIDVRNWQAPMVAEAQTELSA